MIKRDDERRVVVTGLGVVSSLGIGWEKFWKNLMAGKSGISRITAFDTSQYDRHYAGEVKNFEPTQFIDRRKINQMGRASQFAIVATQLAFKDAKLKLDNSRRNKIGICIGTTMGESQVIEQIVKHTIVKKEVIKNLRVLIYPANMIASNVAKYFGLVGENAVFANACAAGNYAIGRAFDLIKSGKINLMIAGGSDAISRIAFTGFGRIFAMAPEKCQPFDKNRKGMLIGEGAGILVLETLQNALKRKARIYAEILGYGLSSDAKHMTSPAIDGITRAIKQSLSYSKVKISEVDYISAHGTATLENDRAECQAIRSIFGKFTDDIPVSSIKSMLGHTMGAAAALESIVCCLSIYKKEVPPTINFDNQDPKCNIDCVPNKGRRHRVKIALNNSQAFGGNNASVIFLIYQNA